MDFYRNSGYMDDEKLKNLVIRLVVPVVSLRCVPTFYVLFGLPRKYWFCWKRKNTDTIQCFSIGRERKTVSMFDDRIKGLSGSDL